MKTSRSWFAQPWVVAAGLCGVAACESVVQPASTTRPVTTSVPFVVSSPVNSGSAVRGAAAASQVAGSTVVYVSLAPGAIPNGVNASISVLNTDSSVAVQFVNGGFDPVVIAAAAGDTILVVAQLSGVASPSTFRFTVPVAAPPIIVRTDPPPHKRDVPLNASIVIVFSEPIDAASLADGSISVRQGTTAVAGQLSFADAAHVLVQFVPAAPLAGTTDYTLLVAQSVRDVNGLALASAATVEFTTVAASAPLTPVATVSVVPSHATVVVGTTVNLGASLHDAANVVLSGRVVTWQSNVLNVTVSSAGVATGVAPGVATITATSEGQSGTATITVAVPPVVNLTFASMSAGNGRTTCGLTNTGAAYCWGAANSDALRNAPRFATPTPIAVDGGRVFATVSVGTYHTCGLTAAGAAYCWGSNFVNELGDGTTNDSAMPVAVIGGLTFASVTAGLQHTCGLTTSGAAYCWGWGQIGELGTGVLNVQTSTPLAVSGGLTFTALATGPFRTCGLTATGAAYCWGDRAVVPTAVGGGLTFISISPDEDGSTCGLTNRGDAYCWDDLTPIAVPGGLKFTAVSTGVSADYSIFGVDGPHACGLTASGAAYCWGDNSYGGLGDGTYTSSDTPVAVSGGHLFTSISSGSGYSCGRTADGTVYCWGYNNAGQLGNGPIGYTSTPVRVGGGS